MPRTNIPHFEGNLFEIASELTNETRSEADQLEDAIEALDTLYELGMPCIHPVTKQVVSDYEYDQMRKRLAAIRPDSRCLKDVTASTAEFNGKTVRHDPPMVSINKANGTLEEKLDELSKWEAKVRASLGYKCAIEDWAVMSFKRDGVAIGLNYEKGRLVSAGLRPRNGVDGEDVTENAKYVEGIPTKLPLPITCSIRGELECKISVFNKLNKVAAENGDQVFSNPRNYTTGSIRQIKDPTITKKRQLNFTAYTIENLDNPPYKTAKERAKWCNKVLGVPFVEVQKFDLNVLQNVEEHLAELDYETDGMVIEVDNLEDAEQMGRHGDNPTGNPRAKIAWKPAEEHADVVIKSIRWQTGRTGKVTPIAEFNPVRLAGTMVSQCTLHNVGLVLSKQIGVGAKIRVIKSGKIIPKCVQVLVVASSVDYPSHCPECGSKLAKSDNGDKSELYCENEAACPAQAVGRLVNYLSTIGVKGLAESVVTQLLEGGLVKRPADFYELGVKELIDFGISKRTAILTIARIWMLDNPESLEDDEILDKLNDKLPKGQKLSLPLPVFIQALGIPGASKGTGRALAGHFGTMDKIFAATVDELETVPDVGAKTAEILQNYFVTYKSSIVKLLDYIELEKPKTGKLTGKSFVFTGTFSEKRDDLVKQAENAGAKVSGSVSKKTNFVVVGADAGSKATKAAELGVPIISLDEFKKML